jgi:hypothetical protein
MAKEREAKKKEQDLQKLAREREARIEEWKIEEAKKKRKEYRELQKRQLETKRESEKWLASTISLIVPDFLESGTTGEIIISLTNTTDIELKDMSIDFSDLAEEFDIIKSVDLNRLKPGAGLKKTVKLQSKHEEGTFPVKITISGNDITIVREFIIKVGGTEIY